MADQLFEQSCEQASQELRIPVEVYKRILQSSFEQTDQDLVQLKSAIDAENFSSIQIVSHRLKGVYLNLRQNALSAPMVEMNDLGKKAANLPRVKECYALFNSAYNALKLNFS